ncbi:hypothetical protein PC113_g19661 [Phytophthora cactorum]|uniref:Uncharacterized protein n=1 Tax=Phytophthora cactorum TaxID=29920 RepID=A0A8T0Y8W8_9STRA|nr:hypothetical protein PC113_g19661 [Phytophthora cactorum]
MIAPDTACVVVGESGGVPEYAEVVNEASAVCETKDEDVNTIDNGDACQKQCYDEEGVEYGNGSYVTSNYYPMDEYVNEYGTSYGCGEHNVGRYVERDGVNAAATTEEKPLSEDLVALADVVERESLLATDSGPRAWEGPEFGEQMPVMEAVVAATENVSETASGPSTAVPVEINTTIATSVGVGVVSKSYMERIVEGGVNVIVKEIVRAKYTMKPFQLLAADEDVVLENVGVALSKVEEMLQSTTVSEQRGPRLSGVLTSALRGTEPEAWNDLEANLDTRIRCKSLELGRPIEDDELRVVASRVKERWDSTEAGAAEDAAVDTAWMDVIIGGEATEVSTTRKQIPEIQKVKLEVFNVFFTGSTLSKDK